MLTNPNPNPNPKLLVVRTNDNIIFDGELFMSIRVGIKCVLLVDVRIPLLMPQYCGLGLDIGGELDVGKLERVLPSAP